MIRAIRRLLRGRGHCLRLAGLPVEAAPQYVQDRFIERRWRERVARNIERRRAVQSPSSVHITHDHNWIPPYLRAALGRAQVRRQAA